MEITSITSTLRLNNGVEMPRLGLGTWDARGEEGTAAALSAMALGYRLFDTAAFYQNEAALGAAVRRGGVPREELFITTKVWNDAQFAGPAAVRAAFSASLAALGLDYVDLYLLHWPAPGCFAASWQVLEELYAAGRVRAIGVSNFHTHHLNELLATAKVTPAVNQIELHPYFSQTPLAEACHRLGIAVECWKPLGGRHAGLPGDAAMRDIGAAHGKTAAQAALRWELQRGLITIPKSASPQRQAQNADVFDFALTDAEMAAIDALDAGKRLGEDPDRITEYPKLMGSI